MPIINRKNEDGSISYKVKVNKNGDCFSKTFSTYEDAILYEKYKKRLVECITNFDVPLSQRLRLVDIVEMKKKQFQDERSIREFNLSCERVLQNMKPHVFLSELTYDDWVNCMENISKLHLPVRGNAITKSLISGISIRRIFATISSSISHANEKGCELQNYALEVIQKKINPFLKSEKNGSSRELLS